MTLHYFAYGSNMSSPRLQARLSSVELIATATLADHALRFHKVGSDGSGKCDAFSTDQTTHPLPGVVFRIARTELTLLDRFEGRGHGYERKTVDITLPDGSTRQAETYYATRIDAALLPFAWYHEHVLRGAREHGLPVEHTRSIEQVTVIQDRDRQRHQRELAIYRTDR